MHTILKLFFFMYPGLVYVTDLLVKVFIKSLQLSDKKQKVLEIPFRYSVQLIFPIILTTIRIFQRKDIEFRFVVLFVNLFAAVYMMVIYIELFKTKFSFKIFQHPFNITNPNVLLILYLFPDRFLYALLMSPNIRKFLLETPFTIT